MNKLNLLYDHYKETVNNQKDNEKLRNKLFILLCFLILILMLMIVYPDSIYENLQEIMLNRFGININIELKIFEMFILFISLYITVRYYQINANIEKNYVYVHKLENIFETKYKIPICREGKNYLDKYPMFLNFSYVFYKYIFPFLYSLFLIIKTIFSIKYALGLWQLIFNLIVVIIIVILNISYMIFNFQLMKGGD